MISSYFVVSRGSGNIIRVIHRSTPPEDSATVINVYASHSNVNRYEALFAAGQDLINVASVLKDDSNRPQRYVR